MVNNNIIDINSLNTAQQNAVLKSNGPFLVLAGAGSGKTRVLTQRIIHLITQRHIDPNRILAVTFTNKAASEMKNRIAQAIPPEQAKDLWVGTFHSICNRILRFDIKKVNQEYNNNFAILDSSESQAFIRESIKSLNLDDKIYIPKKIAYAISELKSNCIEPADLSKDITDYYTKNLQAVYLKYQEKLLLSNSLDFDDLLLLTLKLLKNNEEKRNYYANRFNHVLVDEFQDTNKVQYDFIKLLINSSDWNDKSFCAVGDIDQSIYSWRGADYRIALNFQKDFPDAELIKLEENYRSTGNILNTANAVISNNQERIPKDLVCTKGNGEKIIKLETADELEESFFITQEIRKLQSKQHQYNDIAILYRTNAQSRSVEESLIKAGMPYKLIGGMKFYERLEIKDAIAYLRVIYNSRDVSALKRVINSPKRGIGASTIKTLEMRADELKISLFGAMQDLVDSGGLTPKITQAIHTFTEVISELIIESQKISVPELLKLTLEKTGYLRELESNKTEESESRIENLRELMNVAEDFMHTSDDVSLEAFLGQIALVGETDSLNNTDQAVTLMTIHASKGLEYPIVFIIGLEEGIFPHVRALQTNKTNQLEEERRLLYVAITRAEEKLYITHARRRRLYGMREYAEPSRFLAEMPEEYFSKYYDNVKSATKTISRQAVRPESSSQQQQPKQQLPVDEISFKEGENVQHKSFGEGQVIGILGSQRRKFYTVQFTNAEFGKKMLAANSLKRKN